MATAEGGDGRELAQPPGLGVPGPRTRRSTATGDMAVAVAPAPAGCGEEEEERQMEGPQQLYVLGLSVALPLAVAVARLDAGVPRKARTIRPRAEPSDWWTFRIPVPLVKEGKNSPADGKRPVPPEAPRLDAAEQIVEKPAKRAKRCVQCGKEETPQWRSGPMGRSTLCNACGVRLRAAGALRETEQRPPPATPRKVAHPPPPPPAAESPASDSSPDNPICERRAPIGDIYLVRKQPKSERWSPRKEAAPAPSPAVYLVKKKKPSKKPRKPRNTGQRCLHCGTTSTPQWREGPMGRHTLCNACGVRHRQGRLLPEYRPAASPTFVPSEHASRHSEVLQLHRQRRTNTQPGLTGDSGDAPESDEDDKNNVVLLRRQPPEKDHCPPTPLHRTLPQPVDDDPRARGNNGLAVTPVAGCGGGDVVTDVPSSLDSQLLDVPSAPLIVDGDESLVASEP